MKTDFKRHSTPIAYRLKFASKKDLGKDYVVMPLEALWWAGNR
jgi:hypothetical protein